jgi:hypothetical protein
MMMEHVFIEACNVIGIKYYLYTPFQKNLIDELINTLRIEPEVLMIIIIHMQKEGRK